MQFERKSANELTERSKTIIVQCNIFLKSAEATASLYENRQRTSRNTVEQKWEEGVKIPFLRCSTGRRSSRSSRSVSSIISSDNHG
jgi:hypothetical protein